MGQSASTSSAQGPAPLLHELRRAKSARRSKSKRQDAILIDDEDDDYVPHSPGKPHPFDCTYDLPDESLAFIFKSLGAGDRKSCSLVCRRWFRIEGESRQRLSLDAQSDLVHAVPSLFVRFDSVTKLTLKCDRRSFSIGDEALVMISSKCRNLTRLKLRACREITDDGIEAFSKNCRSLKKFSCGSCTFGAKGMNAVLENCTGLEELSVKRLRGITDRNATELVGSGSVSSSLKVLCLKELYNGQCFGPLITASESLKSLKLIRCSGDWDTLLKSISNSVNEISEVHLERIQVSDVGLGAISNCPNLEILHLVKTPDCTNAGLITVSGRCNLLRKLHIDGWKANRIGDEGLISVAKNCPNLQELVLIGVNPTHLSLEPIASNCQSLERLALCGSESVGDLELLCVAAKCNGLKKLCIKNCPAVSDHGMEALARGCPNLTKVKVKKCRGVSLKGADWLRTRKGSVDVNMDIGEDEHQDLSASDPSQGEFVDANSQLLALTARSSSSKARLSLWRGGSFVASTLRRWSSMNSRHNN